MRNDFRQVLMLQKMRIFNRLRIQTFSRYVGFARKNGVKYFHLYSTEKFIKIQQIEVFGRHGAAHGIILICVCDIPRIRRITTLPPQAE